MVPKERKFRPLIIKLTEAFQEENLEKSIQMLREIFTGIEYDLHIAQEKYYQTLFYLTLILSGFRISTELRTKTLSNLMKGAVMIL